MKNFKQTIATTSVIVLISTNLLYANGDIGELDKKDNPFYPKYLKENIEHAVEVLVQEKLKSKKKKNTVKCNQTSEVKKKKTTKKKKTYPKIPSRIIVKSLSKNSKGDFVLITEKGSIITKGTKLYGGTVKDITMKNIIIERRENGVLRKHYINSTIVF